MVWCRVRVSESYCQNLSQKFVMDLPPVVLKTLCHIQVQPNRVSRVWYRIDSNGKASGARTTRNLVDTVQTSLRAWNDFLAGCRCLRCAHISTAGRKLKSKTWIKWSNKLVKSQPFNWKRVSRITLRKTTSHYKKNIKFSHPRPKQAVATLWSKRRCGCETCLNS